MWWVMEEMLLSESTSRSYTTRRLSLTRHARADSYMPWQLVWNSFVKPKKEGYVLSHWDSDISNGNVIHTQFIGVHQDGGYYMKGKEGHLKQFKTTANVEKAVPKTPVVGTGEDVIPSVDCGGTQCNKSCVNKEKKLNELCGNHPMKLKWSTSKPTVFQDGLGGIRMPSNMFDWVRLLLIVLQQLTVTFCSFILSA